MRSTLFLSCLAFAVDARDYNFNRNVRNKIKSRVHKNLNPTNPEQYDLKASLVSEVKNFLENTDVGDGYTKGNRKSLKARRFGPIVAAEWIKVYGTDVDPQTDESAFIQGCEYSFGKIRFHHEKTDGSDRLTRVWVNLKSRYDESMCDRVEVFAQIRDAAAGARTFENMSWKYRTAGFAMEYIPQSDLESDTAKLAARAIFEQAKSDNSGDANWMACGYDVKTYIPEANPVKYHGIKDDNGSDLHKLIVRVAAWANHDCHHLICQGTCDVSGQVVNIQGSVTCEILPAYQRANKGEEHLSDAERLMNMTPELQALNQPIMNENAKYPSA